MTNITADSLIRRSEHVLTSDLEGCDILANVETNRYFELNSTGTRVWKLLAGEHDVPVASVCEQLAKSYAGFDDAKRQLVLDYLNMLHELKLIHASTT